MIYRKRRHRRPDPLIVLMFAVITGFGVTVSYQILNGAPTERSEVAAQPTVTQPTGATVAGG